VPSGGATPPRGAALPLWIAFVLVHLVLSAINLYAVAANPIGDVRVVYLGWAQDALAGRVPGIDESFVYPVLALAPILSALALGAQVYAETWMLLVSLLDAVAFAALIGAPWRRGEPVPGRRAAGWFWLGFLALLGPIAIGRIDAVTVPMAMMALLWAVRRPVVATLLLTAATWIKVWPAAALAAVLIVSRARGRVVLPSVLASVGIVLVALALGSGSTVFSFFGEQAGRGLQIEAPVSTAWLWLASAGVGGTTVSYDRDILTFQVSGEGTALASAASAPLMILAVAAMAAGGIRAFRRGAGPVHLLPLLTLGLVCALIVFNKVGSPQFACWLAPPLILGIVTARERFRTPVVLALAIAALTQLIYPYLYGMLLAVDPVMLVIVTLRNLLLVCLFLWCGAQVWKAGNTPSAPPPGGIPRSADRRAVRGGI
jgi:hypothetical protein